MSRTQSWMPASGPRVNTFEDMAWRTWVWVGSIPLAVMRQVMSRSVMIPASRRLAASITGIAPKSPSAIWRATLTIVSCGVQQWSFGVMISRTV